MNTLDHPIVGFRSFVPNDTQDGQIKSRFAIAYEWQRGINSAECRQDVHRVGDRCIENTDYSRDHSRVKDTVPSTECTCGFYAHHTYQESLDYMSITSGMQLHQTVFGLVKGWGRIQVHYDGFRSQYMEILAIVPGVNSEYDKKAADYYGVPYLTGDIEIMAGEFGKRAPIESRPTQDDVRDKYYQNITKSGQRFSDTEELIVMAFVLAYLAGISMTLRVVSLIAGKFMKHIRK